MVKNQRFCPSCGSENVEPDFRRTNVLGEMIFNQNKWLCKACGYTGIMPEGDPEQVNEGEKIEFEKNQEESGEVIDTSAGRGYLRYELYILIPLTLLYLIYLLLTA